MNRCPRCRAPIVPGEGPPDAELVVVGQAPGATEFSRGRPFVGPSGRLLREALAQAGFAPRSVYLTNASLCRCPPSRERLFQELRDLRYAQLILCTGRVSGELLLPHLEPSDLGRLQWAEDPGNWVIVTHHPARILRSREPEVIDSLARDFFYAVDLAARILREGIDLVPETRVHCPETVSEAVAAIWALRRCALIAYDVEVSGPHWRRGRIGCLSLSGVPGEALVLLDPILHHPRVLEALRDLFRKPRGRWVAHNAMFDNRFLLQELGVRPAQVEDTMFLEYCLDERPRGHLGLKYLAGRELLVPDWRKPLEQHLRARRRSGYLEAAREVLVPYAAADADMTRRLYLRLRPRLEGGLRRAYELLQRAARMFEDVDRRGIWIDLDYGRALEEAFRRSLAEVEARLQAFAAPYGMPHLNPRSVPQLRELLFTRLGLRPTHRTPKGQPSTSQAALAALEPQAPDLPLWDLLREHRRITKLLGTYVTPYLDVWAEPAPLDGRGILYIETSLTATETGRLSTSRRSSPAVMTYPRDPELRKLFVAGPHHRAPRPEGDWWFFQFDYSQLELRVLAWMARCTYAIERMRQGVSFHKVAAEAIWGPNYSKEQYAATKRFNFGLIYSGGNEMAGVAPGMGVEEARRMAALFREKMPELFAWFEETARKVQDPGWVETPFGRRRRFPIILGAEHLEKLRKECCNFMIQSTASDITLESMYRVWEELDAWLSLRWMMHDAVLGYVSREALPKLLDAWDILEEVGSALTGNAPPITAELSLGRNWGELTEFPDRQAFRDFLASEV